MTCVIAAVNTGEVIINQLKETTVPNPECLRDLGTADVSFRHGKSLRRNEDLYVRKKLTADLAES